MFKRTTSLSLLLSCLLVVTITACDQSSQNIDFDPGNNLTVSTVSGSQSRVIPNFDSTTTAEYQVRAYTTLRDYEWSVENGTLDSTPRNGENAVVSSSSPNMTVTVTTTVDGEQVSGSAGGMDYPTVGAQASKYGQLNLFGELLSATGLKSPLESDAPLGPRNPDFVNNWTAFAPSDNAFANALDADGNGTISDAERPALGVIVRILQYHVVDNFLRADSISGQTPATLLHPDETLSLTRSGGNITVGATNVTATVETPDIATNDGVVHMVDNVLLPASVVSINGQTVSRGNGTDTVDVEGTYVQDGGFIALHEESPSGEIIGVSDELDPGFHGNVDPIEITLDSQLSDTTNIVAMPHRDNPDDGQFTFADPLGGDPPYTRGGSSVPVVDSASVATP